MSGWGPGESPLGVVQFLFSAGELPGLGGSRALCHRWTLNVTSPDPAPGIAVRPSPGQEAASVEEAPFTSPERRLKSSVLAAVRDTE